jgi:phosphohistidine phosphatase
VKRLLILRHAKAEKDAPRRDDFERALSPRGEADAMEAGRRLAARGTVPDAIVSSPAQRALQTAKIVARELDFPWGSIRREKVAYLADAETLLRVAQLCEEDVGVLMLVGHNPGVSELVRALVRRFDEDLPTCAVAAIDCAADTWGGVRPGCGSLRWFEVPRALR